MLKRVVNAADNENMPVCRRSSKTCRHRRLAVTLIELMIVVAILAIVALMVIPSFGATQQTRVNNAATLLVADIEHAQLESISNCADPFLIVFDASNDRYYLARNSAPITPATNPSTGAAYQTTYGQGRASALNGVTITAIDLNGDNQLGFTSLGSLDQSYDARITLQCGDKTVRVVISATTGRPSVE